MRTVTRWTPTDWLKLVALIGGFCLFALGAWMLHLGIAAEGVVDIKSTILSGTLKTASAGLFICFFAFLIIIFTLVFVRASPKVGATPKTGGAKSKSDQLRPFFWALLAGVIICAIGAATTEAEARAAYISVGTPLGFALTFLVAVIARTVLDHDA